MLDPDSRLLHLIFLWYPDLQAQKVLTRLLRILLQEYFYPTFAQDGFTPWSVLVRLLLPVRCPCMTQPQTCVSGFARRCYTDGVAVMLSAVAAGGRGCRGHVCYSGSFGHDQR